MKKVLKNLTLAYYAVYIIAILSAVLGYYILKSGISIDSKSSTGVALESILIIFIIGSVPLTLAGFNKLTKKWAQISDTAIKLRKYQQGSLIRIAIIGLGFILGVIFYYLLKNQSMLFCAGISAIALFFCKPAEVKIVTELDLEDID